MEEEIINYYNFNYDKKHKLLVDLLTAPDTGLAIFKFRFDLMQVAGLIGANEDKEIISENKEVLVGDNVFASNTHLYTGILLIALGIKTGY